MLSISIVVLITGVHSINLKSGSLFQRIFTGIKITCILLFIAFGLFHTPSHTISFVLNASAIKDIFSSAFAGSLIYVTYAYSGWNAAAYISGEIKDAKKNLPKALFIGTLLVMFIYTILNFVFLQTVPISELKGVVEVGYLSASKIFGAQIGQFASLVIAVLLISTISAMILAGPRVMQSMGNNISGLKFFARANMNNVPYVAIIFQSIIALVLVLTSSFESLITYVSFTLNLFTLLTVFGIFILRYKHKQVKTSYKTPLYPLTPVLFLIILLWIIINIIKERPTESLYGFITVAAGLIIYFVTKKKDTNRKQDNILIQKIEQ
jgi:APA family basic amino acid/polyamine antiporter